MGHFHVLISWMLSWRIYRTNYEFPIVTLYVDRATGTLLYYRAGANIRAFNHNEGIILIKDRNSLI